MNWTNIILGSVFLVIGVSCTILRFTKPHLLGKLEAMKKAWGNSAGSIIHFLAYSLIPIIFGVYFIVLGIKSGG